ncbi:hypothetical protein JZ751_014907 [Albula glossodonta]|uniref:DNA fragmentation factor 40 C-terminal domain-containing protein n=1 Tax=Albula glossodonta TaxID=121402 RepID=A0A8T2N4Q7_9TELE|nr:hypothetical protein JZ751_014907 [Albula glossodonta]
MSTFEFRLPTQVASDIGLLLGFSNRHTDDLIKSAKDLLTDERSDKKRKILRDLLNNLKENAEAEKREEDEDWFLDSVMYETISGIDSRFKTKSAYMKFNCESRIRGYMKDVDGFVQSIQSTKVQREYKKIADCMTEKLKSAKYNGCYFDRNEKESNRLCTKEGWFSCQGAFDQDKCNSLHSINPYGSRESRIVFSTWNLDHRIEKKRTIIPALAKALQNRKSSDMNWDYFYSLLFTWENLKLVHIVCHKKGAHDLQCDSKKIYKREKQKRK